jgi:26S proteasome regulatory subunit T4
MKELRKAYDKSENDLKALQSIGQIIGELLRPLDEERCETSSHCMPQITLVSHLFFEKNRQQIL